MKINKKKIKKLIVGNLGDKDNLHWMQQNRNKIIDVKLLSKDEYKKKLDKQILKRMQRKLNKEND